MIQEAGHRWPGGLLLMTLFAAVTAAFSLPEKEGSLTDQEAIRQAAREAVEETFRRLGIDVDDADSVRELHADMGYLRRTRKGQEALAQHTKRAAITTGIGAAVTMLIYSLWDGIKAALGFKAGL